MAKKKDKAPTLEEVELDIDSIQPNLWNPNIQDSATFNALVENIRGHGFIGPVQVVPVGDGLYMLIGGEHRWKAAKIVGLKKIRATVITGWDEDMQKIQTVKLNVLRGKLNPKKFTELWLGLEKKYGSAALQRMMGFGGKETLLRGLLKQVEASVPKELRQSMKSALEKVRSVEDLATVVQSLYAQFGSTLRESYMFLQFGGKTHLMVKLRPDTLGQLHALLPMLADAGLDANELVERALSAVAHEMGKRASE